MIRPAMIRPAMIRIFPLRSLRSLFSKNSINSQEFGISIRDISDSRYFHDPCRIYVKSFLKYLFNENLFNENLFKIPAFFNLPFSSCPLFRPALYFVPLFRPALYFVPPFISFINRGEAVSFFDSLNFNFCDKLHCKLYISSRFAISFRIFVSQFSFENPFISFVCKFIRLLLSLVFKLVLVIKISRLKF